MKRATVLISVLILLALPALAAAPKGWDAKRVQGIATQLADALDEVRDALRGLQPPPHGSGRRAFHSTVDDVRLLRNSARHLATMLADGAGYEETYPTYRRIQSIRRDAAENSQRTGVIPNDVLTKIDKARDLSFQLWSFYEGE